MLLGGDSIFSGGFMYLSSIFLSKANFINLSLMYLGALSELILPGFPSKAMTCSRDVSTR